MGPPLKQSKATYVYVGIVRPTAATGESIPVLHPRLVAAQRRVGVVRFPVAARVLSDLSIHLPAAAHVAVCGVGPFAAASHIWAGQLKSVAAADEVTWIVGAAGTDYCNNNELCALNCVQQHITKVQLDTRKYI